MKLTYETHEESSPVPGLTTIHQNRGSAVEHLRAYGGYCTVKAGGCGVTRKANGHDLEGMLSDMADLAIKKSSRSALRLPVPASPEKSPRAASDNIFRQVTGHFPKHGA